MNEALARLDSLVLPAVIDERADPPAEPVAGDCHLVGPAPTGAWAGQAYALATWAENQWLFAAPAVGALIFDRGSGCFAVFSAEGAWRRAPVPPPPPAAGVTQDAEDRAAITAILDGLQALGIFA